MTKRKRKIRGKGEGTVYERGDGKWCGQITVGRDRISGRPIRETFYADTEAECISKVDEARQRRASVSLVTAPEGGVKWTVKGYSAWWLDALKHKLQPQTYSRYSLDVTYINAVLGSHRLEELTAWDVAEAYRKLASLQYSPDAQHQAGVRLRQLLKHAAGVGVVRENIALLVPLPRVQREEMHPLTKEQCGSLFAATDSTRFGAFFRLAVDSGARAGELWALTWGDWSFNRTEIHFHRSLEELNGEHRIKESKTKASRRTVAIADTTALMLEAHREAMRAEKHGGDTNTIFCTPRGTYLRRSNFARREWKPALAAAGLPDIIRLHDLRHTCAVLLLQAGEHLRAISARLGHASPETTLRIYSHYAPEMGRRSASLMDRILG